MSNVHGKDIPLQYVTVKVPGQKPRGSRTVQTQQSNPQSHNSESNFGSTNSTSVSTSSSTSNIMSGGVTSGTKGEKVLLTSYEMLSGDNVVENNNDIEKINVNNAQVNMQRSLLKVSVQYIQNYLDISKSDVILIIVILGKNNSKCKEATSSKD